MGAEKDMFTSPGTSRKLPRESGNPGKPPTVNLCVCGGSGGILEALGLES